MRCLGSSIYRHPTSTIYLENVFFEVDEIGVLFGWNLSVMVRWFFTTGGLRRFYHSVRTGSVVLDRFNDIA